MNRLLLSIISLVLCLLLFSCEAEHSNPLDPINPGYKYGQIEGRVFAEDNIMLQGVRVVWENQNAITITDTNGSYKIDNIERTNGKVYFEKEGFAKASVQVNWSGQQNRNLGNTFLKYAIGQIVGHVSSPEGSLAGVSVLWENQKIITTTDIDGNYIINNVARDSGKVYFEKYGYKKDYVSVNWTDQQSYKITLGNKILRYDIGDVYGYVFSNKAPLGGVRATWKNQSTYSGSDGKYEIKGVVREPGKVYFEKDGYAKDSSLAANWDDNTLQVRLDKTLRYSIGKLDGFIVSNPDIPAEGVRVTWKNQDVVTVVTYSNSAGYYKIEGITTNLGKLYFEKTGLITDSVDVDWGEEDSIRVNPPAMLYNIGSLSGWISKYPDIRVPGVKVTWENQNITVASGSDGHFKINNLPMISGTLTFEKDGFQKKSRYVQWDNLVDSINVGNIFLSFTSGDLSGSVSEEFSGNPIPSVQVLWKNLNKITYTNSNGVYSFENVPYDNGKLYFLKDGYYKDSVQVYFTTQDSFQTVSNKSLSFIPALDSGKVTTTVKYDFNAQTYSLSLRAWINDPSRKIKSGSIYAKCTSLNFNRPLNYDSQGSYYYIDYNFGQNNISKGLGNDFQIIAKDALGNEFLIGTTRLTRVIDKEITVRSPINSEVVNPQPTLTWDRFLPGFDFTYSIYIWDETTTNTRSAWSREGVSQDDISIMPEYILSSGKYFWYITCVDEFGNLSTSKIYKFVIQ